MVEHLPKVQPRINKTQIVYEICLGLVFAYSMFWVCLGLVYPMLPAQAVRIDQIMLDLPTFFYYMEHGSVQLAKSQF